MSISSQSAKTPFIERSVNWLSLAIAGAVTFFAQPFAIEATSGPVQRFAENHYGASIAFGVGPIWWLLCGGSIFLLVNLTLKLGVSGGVVSFFRRLF